MKIEMFSFDEDLQRTAESCQLLATLGRPIFREFFRSEETLLSRFYSSSFQYSRHFPHKLAGMSRGQRGLRGGSGPLSSRDDSVSTRPEPRSGGPENLGGHRLGDESRRDSEKIFTRNEKCRRTGSQLLSGNCCVEGEKASPGVCRSGIGNRSHSQVRLKKKKNTSPLVKIPRCRETLGDVSSENLIKSPSSGISIPERISGESLGRLRIVEDQRRPQDRGRNSGS